MPSCRAVSDVWSMKIEASYPAWLYPGKEKSWHCAWRSIKACPEMISVASRCKKLPVPHCAPGQWLNQTDFIQEHRVLSLSPFSPVLGESLKKILNSYEIEHLLVYSMELKDSGTERCKKSNLSCLIEAFWCVLIPTPSHGKSAGSLAWRLSTSFFGLVLFFLPDLVSTCRSYFLFLTFKHLSQLFILSQPERYEKIQPNPNSSFSLIAAATFISIFHLRKFNMVLHRSHERKVSVSHCSVSH